ncbi:uncharacterized protein LOC129288309 [Prosopis cineraria]|uniref:uncharacterized protein LOC129288309 n=1 Tax=Prosopis cineraria TaxID=364024 RepID=UPI00240F3BC0|nr:uncharacterized protein LOC129288309 [Prosopis cineraria]
MHSHNNRAFSQSRTHSPRVKKMKKKKKQYGGRATCSLLPLVELFDQTELPLRHGQENRGCSKSGKVFGRLPLATALYNCECLKRFHVDYDATEKLISCRSEDICKWKWRWRWWEPAGRSISSHYLKVKSQDGDEVFFKIKKGTPLRKLINAYCDRTSQNPESVAFLFDGRRIRPEHTPRELEMEDGDEIDAMLHRTEGGIH